MDSMFNNWPNIKASRACYRNTPIIISFNSALINAINNNSLASSLVVSLDRKDSRDGGGVPIDDYPRLQVSLQYIFILHIKLPLAQRLQVTVTFSLTLSLVYKFVFSS